MSRVDIGQLYESLLGGDPAAVEKVLKERYRSSTLNNAGVVQDLRKHYKCIEKKDRKDEDHKLALCITRVLFDRRDELFWTRAQFDAEIAKIHKEMQDANRSASLPPVPAVVRSKALGGLFRARKPAAAPAPAESPAASAA